MRKKSLLRVCKPTELSIRLVYSSNGKDPNEIEMKDKKIKHKELELSLESILGIFIFFELSLTNMMWIVERTERNRKFLRKLQFQYGSLRAAKGIKRGKKVIRYFLVARGRNYITI